MAPRPRLTNEQKKARRREAAIFNSRKWSYFRKGSELYKIVGARVCVVLEFRDRFYIFKATDSPNWPPSEENIKKCYPQPDTMGMDDFYDQDDGPLPDEGEEKTKHTVKAPELESPPDAVKLLSLCIASAEETE